jgi:hypothetical protein
MEINSPYTVKPQKKKLESITKAASENTQTHGD